MFINRIIVDLTLKIDGKSYKIESGNIKNLDLKLSAYGYEATLDWWKICLNKSSEDTIKAAFMKNSLIEVTMSIDRFFDKGGEAAAPIKLKGIVTTKRFHARAFEDVSGEPVLHRHYFISFKDPASVLWGQHFPCDLYTKKSVKDLIEDHKTSNFLLSYACTPMTTKHPFLFLGLGQKESSASFYDFVIWYLKSENAGMYYNGTKNTYTLTTKKDTSAKIKDFPVADADIVNIEFTETPRYSVNVLNSYATKSTTEKVANKDEVKGIRKDILIASPIASTSKSIKTNQTSKLVDEQPFLTIEYARYPTVDALPGTIYLFNKSDWSKELYQSNKKFRLRELRLLAEAESQLGTDDADEDSNSYKIQLTSVLEEKEEVHHPLPEFVTPYWPAKVEGKIVSEIGKETEETYQLYEDDSKSLEQYHVEIPLWKKQKIMVNHDPNLFPGHFYFPLYKDHRVLVDMSFKEAWIKRHLEWRAGAKLPNDKQANHILFGKNPKDSTSMVHAYKEKKPVFSITRLLDKDTQLIQVSEGEILIETKENEK